MTAEENWIRRAQLWTLLLWLLNMIQWDLKEYVDSCVQEWFISSHQCFVFFLHMSGKKDFLRVSFCQGVVEKRFPILSLCKGQKTVFGNKPSSLLTTATCYLWKQSESRKLIHSWWHHAPELISCPWSVNSKLLRQRALCVSGLEGASLSAKTFLRQISWQPQKKSQALMANLRDDFRYRVNSIPSQMATIWQQPSQMANTLMERGELRHEFWEMAAREQFTPPEKKNWAEGNLSSNKYTGMEWRFFRILIFSVI